MRPVWGLTAVVSSIFVIGAAAPPGAATGGVGYDVSFPQCDTRGPHYPANPAFAIVGVNGGRTAANPCLGPWHGQLGQLAWASGAAGLASQPRVSYYLIAADPGPVSPNWPGPVTGRPQRCTGTWSNACAYDYGYQRAISGLRVARWIAAVDRSHHVPVGDPAGAPWWIDVETEAPWATTATPEWAAVNVAAVAGSVAGLEAVGVRVDRIGFYSTTYQWHRITGLDPVTSKHYFSPLHPDWVPGAKNLDQARWVCGRGKSFSGGPITLAQYRSGDFDADYRCP